MTSIDHENKIAKTDTGHEYEYDICVVSTPAHPLLDALAELTDVSSSLQIATGSDAGMPPYCSVERGKKTKGVFVYRNIGQSRAS